MIIIEGVITTVENWIKENKYGSPAVPLPGAGSMPHVLLRKYAYSRQIKKPAGSNFLR
ncbi:MAG: hypothetical protein J7M18_01805 [Candidatus Eremiobacteraeota bacterium]|nr:hypothetical protein [Candidatus Eremiobacteraeota bacterium]